MRRLPSRPISPSRRSLLAGAAAAAWLASCQRSEAPVDETGRIRLRLATDGPAGVEHAGFYHAVASGAYERRGLTVQIVQGGPDADVPRRLAEGAVELGLSSSSFMAMNLLAEGAPVRAVAAFLQKDPQVLVAHPDPDLETVQDLTERPFILGQTARAGVWTWLRTRYGFNDGQLRPDDGELTPFLRDEAAVISGSLTRLPQAVRRAARFEPRVFLLADEGYPSYGGVLLAPNAFARDNADTLRAFIAASVEGWRDYIQGDPGSPGQLAADALIRRDQPALDQAALDAGRAALKTGFVVTGGDAAMYGLGAMTEDRWKAFFESGRDAGLYPPNLDWRQAFTNGYLPGRR